MHCIIYYRLMMDLDRPLNITHVIFAFIDINYKN